MKITRRQLKALISEELNLDEVAPPVLFPLVPVGAAAGGAALASAPAWLPAAGVATVGSGGLLAILGGLLAGAVWWMSTDDDEKERIMTLVNKENLQAAFTVYAALKGLGTDEDAINAALDAEAIPKVYSDFARILQVMGEDTDVDLEQWLRDDGMDDLANTVQNTIELALRTYRGSASRA